jgi:hypothetical protein
MTDTGLAASFEKLFFLWDELEDITIEVAKFWEKRLDQLAQQIGISSDGERNENIVEITATELGERNSNIVIAGFEGDANNSSSRAETNKTAAKVQKIKGKVIKIVGKKTKISGS